MKLRTIWNDCTLYMQKWHTLSFTLHHTSYGIYTNVRASLKLRSNTCIMHMARRWWRKYHSNNIIIVIHAEREKEWDKVQCVYIILCAMMAFSINYWTKISLLNYSIGSYFVCTEKKRSSSILFVVVVEENRKIKTKNIYSLILASNGST